MANTEKVNAVLDWIETHRNQWEQRGFAMPKYKESLQEVDICNSQYCFAGTALFLAGRVTTSKSGGYIVPTYEDGTTDEYADWEQLAAEYLGLTPDQAFSIFYTITDDFDKFKAHVLWVIENPDNEMEMANRRDELSDWNYPE